MDLCVLRGKKECKRGEKNNHLRAAFGEDAVREVFLFGTPTPVLLLCFLLPLSNSLPGCFFADLFHNLKLICKIKKKAKIRAPKKPSDSSTQDPVVQMQGRVRELQPEERFWAVISALTKATFFFFFLKYPDN